MSGRIIGLLSRTVRLLEKLNIPYAVMGGMALQAWGRERSTKDIDITISLGEIREKEFLGHLNRIGLKTVHKGKRIGRFGLIETQYTDPDLGLPLGVDFFIAGTDYQEQVLRRAVLMEALGFQVKFVSPEDLILNKLLSARPLDLNDARHVLLELKNRLDKDYLLHWAKKLGVSRQLKFMEDHRA